MFFDKSLFSALNVLDLIIGLSSHEILNDLNKLVGKEVRNHIIKTIGQEKLSEMDQTIKKLNTIKIKELRKLKNIRNNLLGHKLENGYKQAQMLDNIDIKELYEIGYEIFKNQVNLIKNYYDIIKYFKPK